MYKTKGKVERKEGITDLSIAVRVSMVVMPIPTLPGTEVRGMKRPSQPRRTNIKEGR